ncbi:MULTISPECIES: GNAT family N-acetyltransferase [Natrialbaceae]|uniref:GNAT family N-acetyltransferase n=1 Tax=Natrialbaceae TaxID=1644061 RepID=UPI00207D5695|nr:GNAT family N-acetyltransferase [Natronococcus sp. CG52]
METCDAKPSDTEAVRAAHSNSTTRLETEAYSEEQVNAWAQGCESADYTSAIESEESAFVVAEVDGKVVAFGSLKFASPDAYEADVDAEVTGVYVHPSVAREGVGTRTYVNNLGRGGPRLLLVPSAVR